MGRLMSYPWMSGLLGAPAPSAPIDHAKVAADKRHASMAFAAALSFEPTLAALFKTELEWRAQTRVDGKTVASADELRSAIISLAKLNGWEPAA